MSMAMMVAMASRKRDDRGRYADGNDDRHMGNDHGTYMGDMPEMRRRRDDRGHYMDGDDGARMGYDEPEMRRRRDSRGRYMEGDDGVSMAYDGGTYAHYPWREPHMPPYLDRDMNDANTTSVGRDPHYMRDRNIVNIHDYQDKRLIGFGANDRPHGEGGTDMRQYGRRYDPDRMTMGQQHQRQQSMGMAKGAEDDDHLTLDEAEKWVQGMKSEDGKTGGRWPYREIKQYAANFGIQGEEQIVEFYAVMNALYTDYCKVAKKHGVDKVDFWADLAKAFIHDKDAKSGKVKMYYECIAKKDDE